MLPAGKVLLYGSYKVRIERLEHTRRRMDVRVLEQTFVGASTCKSHLKL